MSPFNASSRTKKPRQDSPAPSKTTESAQQCTATRGDVSRAIDSFVSAMPDIAAGFAGSPMTTRCIKLSPELGVCSNSIPQPIADAVPILLKQHEMGLTCYPAVAVGDHSVSVCANSKDGAHTAVIGEVKEYLKLTSCR